MRQEAAPNSLTSLLYVRLHAWALPEYARACGHPCTLQWSGSALSIGRGERTLAKNILTFLCRHGPSSDYGRRSPRNDSE